MKVCIYGAGAIGGYLAAGLSEVDGVELSVVARGAHLAAIQSSGLKLLIDGRDARLPADGHQRSRASSARRTT